MSTDKNQSAINEVRDQLSLDHADGSYLNTVTGNLGLVRPVFGFDDTTWRAIGRVLAIQFKQIANKFRDVLREIFGPEITQVATLASAAAVGDKTVTLNESENLPQHGTMILDQGLATEETVTYCFIDRYSHLVYLDTALTQAHAAFPNDAENPLSFDVPVNATLVYAPNTHYFPTAGFPYTAVLGRGTANEEVVSVSANDVTNGILTLSAPTTKAHAGLSPTPVQSNMAQNYSATSVYLVLDDSKQFASSGNVLLSKVSASFVGTPFTASAGAVNTVSVAVPTFTEDAQIKNVVVFEGNVTAALAGVEADIVDNTDVQLTFTALGVAPAVGDNFFIRPRLQYTSNDYSQNALLLRDEIRDLVIPANTQVELLETNGQVSLAPVKVAGVGWDVIQSDPRHVEIFLPEALDDTNTVLSASYLHPKSLGFTPATTVASPAVAGDKIISPTSNVSFPITGVITINAGGGTEERIGYKIDHSFLTVATEVGATEITVSDSSLLGGVGDTIHIGVGGFVDTVLIITNDTSTNKITMAPLAFAHDVGDVVYAENMKMATGALVHPHAALETIDLYELAYGATALLRGSAWDIDDLYPGPYVYDLTSRAILHTTTASSVLDVSLAGPTTLESSSLLGDTALEVTDASAFLLTGFPYEVLVGEGTGNREVVTVTDVNLRQRVATAGITINALSLPLSTSLTLTALSGGTAADSFPNAKGYRVLIARGAPNEEVVLVTGTSGLNLLCEPTTQNHVIGETVELLSDVLSVNALADVHNGKITAADRTVRWPTSPTSTRISQAETCRLRYSEIEVLSVAGFPTEGGVAVIDFGEQQLNAESSLSVSAVVGDTTLDLVDSSDFPATYYPYAVTVDVGSSEQEVVFVTNNNIGLNRLTISHGVNFNHSQEIAVAFYSGVTESVTYSSVDSVTNKLRFSVPIMLNSNHWTGAAISPSTQLSVPRATGFDFPLRIPTDIVFRLQTLFDLIRAAGVQLSFIRSR